MRAESDLSKKELILKDNIIQHSLLSNFIILISIYFVLDANLSTILLSSHRLAKICFELSIMYVGQRQYWQF
jgi:hypothetical protein